MAGQSRRVGSKSAAVASAPSTDLHIFSGTATAEDGHDDDMSVFDGDGCVEFHSESQESLAEEDLKG